MVNIYKRNILNGKITIEEVPLKWRADVEAALAADNKKKTR